MRRVRELWLLEAAAARADTMPSEQREHVSRQLDLAAQRVRSAHALWVDGARAEALRYAHEAFRLAADAAVAVLEDATAVTELHARFRDARFPETEPEVTSADTERFFELVDACDRVHDAASWRCLTRDQLKARSRRRILVTLFTIVATALYVVWMVRTPHTRRTEVSSELDLAHPGNYAIDGKPATEWLLPVQTAGWIDVYLRVPTRMRRLKLLDARGTKEDERASREVHVDAFSNGRMVASADSKFVDRALVVPIEGKEIDRVHVEIRTYEKNGGGLAEIEIE